MFAPSAKIINLPKGIEKKYEAGPTYTDLSSWSLHITCALPRHFQ